MELLLNFQAIIHITDGICLCIYIVQLVANTDYATLGCNLLRALLTFEFLNVYSTAHMTALYHYVTLDLWSFFFIDDHLKRTE